MNQKLIATQIAQQIWSETGEMYRVGVSRTGLIEINLSPNDPIPEIKKIVSEMKNIIFTRKTITLNFELEETKNDQIT